MHIDNEPQYTTLDATHQTIGDGASLITARPEVSASINGADLNECGPEAVNNNRLAFRTDAWRAQRIYEFNPIPDFNEQAMDLLSMNWMSPENPPSFVWNGLIAVPPYAENDKNVPSMPFCFPTSSPLPASDHECVPLNNVQAPNIGRAKTSIDGASHSTDTIGKYGSEVSKSMTGSYYVDGDGSRAPFRGQATQQWRGRQMMAADDASTPERSAANYVGGERIGLREDSLVDADGYSNMIRQLHFGLSKQNVPVDAISFPSLQCIALCVHSYFAYFHSTFPFVRKSTFLEDSRENWLLLLAVAVIGSKYDKERLLSPEFTAVLEGMSIRRVCHGRREEAGIPSTSPFCKLENSSFSLPDLQAASLSLICSLHRGKQGMTRCALMERHYLVGACKEFNLLSGESEDSHHHSDGANVVQDWLRKQSRMRTGLMIWVLDAMISYEFNAAPLMQLVDVKVSLPCEDHIWEYPSVEKVAAEQKSSVTLLDVIEMLYIEKRLPESLSEFSNILIIHGIWRRTKEVINQSRTRLTNWIPSAAIQGQETYQSASAETWPPSSPTLSKWRNSACDCLDILHWRANGKAANAGGLEHPTILYLHLSRLILLTPVAQIQTLATNANNTNSTNSAASQRYTEASNCVLKWAINDSFKARLSIIHAGALFWHIRRYSRRCFLEPFAIYMATLIIWAYSISVRFAKQQEELEAFAASMEGPVSSEARMVPTASQQSTTSKDEELVSELSFFYIDRPCDDEMVQIYLRHGDKLSAHMARVGIITQASAPSRILKEGLRLLANDTTGGSSVLVTGSSGLDGPKISTWGAEQTYMGVLDALSQTMGQRQT
ncbi:uncharacterized protein TrAFT101_000148 [Trichoderma asperellum]|uniref:uncharacterized protein n=1 Tax=Trichoderma asperellum TaxID=101201 RepID=UPI00332F90D3|nr:hypothetical protein TrAFT101_000148 [Trichoderma asperellum]